MSLLQAVVLGAVQGLSEFLPISSSGHLIMVPYLVGWPTHSQAFDLALHLGTSAALLWFFWADWLALARALIMGLRSPSARSDLNWRLALMVVVGSLPAGVIGVLIERQVEEAFRSHTLSAVLLIVFALVLYMADRIGSMARPIKELRWADTLTMGFAQAIALVPGVSRSGITITAGLFSGLDRAAAARFSFLLSGPIIIGAALYKLRGGIPAAELAPALAGMVVAAVVGWASIGFLLRYLQERSLLVFVMYRVGFGVLVLAVSLAREGRL
jgi:undecaprenyl-diphosphatase